MPTKPNTITKQLLKAIRDGKKRGMTRYQIAKVSGVSQAQLTRLMQGKQLLRMDTAERIAEALELKIILVSQKENT